MTRNGWRERLVHRDDEGIGTGSRDWSITVQIYEESYVLEVGRSGGTGDIHLGTVRFRVVALVPVIEVIAFYQQTGEVIRAEGDISSEIISTTLVTRNCGMERAHSGEGEYLHCEKRRSRKVCNSLSNGTIDILVDLLVSDVGCVIWHCLVAGEYVGERRTKVSTYRQLKGTDEQIKSTDEQRKAKAVSREKEKGVELKDIEETDKPRPTSTRSLLTLKPLPKIDPKDKGKKKIEEEDESESESDGIPKAEKKFKQLESDEEMA
ncbi:hypothetical protein Tco_0679348 [Tanacetum coccineum]|uniref:Uncharacterized protein n=1 Tax=Tanacetum coccineum TaxID=301880 RepID=A0ABQ4XHU6_9ASTR